MELTNGRQDGRPPDLCAGLGGKTCNCDGDQAGGVDGGDAGVIAREVTGTWKPSSVGDQDVQAAHDSLPRKL